MINLKVIVKKGDPMPFGRGQLLAGTDLVVHITEYEVNVIPRRCRK